MKPTNAIVRRWLSVVLLAASVWWASGCGAAGGGGPGDVVKRYGHALANGDTKTALECISPKNREMAAPMVQMGAALVSGFSKSEGGLDSIKIIQVQEQGDRASVSYQTKTKKGVERPDTVRTEKIQGKWYIAQ